MKDPKTSRGYRNKNPGNIKFNPANKWVGQIRQEEFGPFSVFDSHENGIRAIAVLLMAYQDRHNLRTIRKIIDRWAPTVENNTSAYVFAVTESIGNIGPDDTVNLHEYSFMFPLVKAIIKHELGGVPYSDAAIAEGLERAGIVAAGAEVTPKSAAVVGGSVVAAAGALTDYAIKVLPVIGGLPTWIAGVVIVGLAGAAVAYYYLNRRRSIAS